MMGRVTRKNWAPLDRSGGFWIEMTRQRTWIDYMAVQRYTPGGAVIGGRAMTSQYLREAEAKIVLWKAGDARALAGVQTSATRVAASIAAEAKLAEIRGIIESVGGIGRTAALGRIYELAGGRT